MSSIDQFESLFRSAVQTRYTPRSYPIREVLVLTDLPEGEDTTFLTQLEPLFQGLTAPPKLTLVPCEQSQNLEQLLELIEGSDHIDLICTYRNLHTPYGDYPYTLGGHVAVLTQVCTTPILLTPRPESLGGANFKAPERVMALTDHVEAHPQLIDAAISMIPPSGTLFLSHVEDEATFERYMGVIAKIPGINTDEARELIQAQLLGDAQRYLESTKATLKESHTHLEVGVEVGMGHHLQEHTARVRQGNIELLVINTKDDDQLAMHGLSHPLAIELSDLPLLLL